MDDQLIKSSPDKNVTEMNISEAIRDHTHDGVLSQRISAEELDDWEKNVLYRIVKHDTPTATGTSITGDLVMPFSGVIKEVGATVDTAGTTGTTTVDINKNATSILDTKITIDSGEKTSRTAATPFVFTDNTLVEVKTGDIITFDIDAINTTPANGLSIFMNILR